MDTAAIIARFQTPYLHEGHVHLINQVSENHSKVVIVLGTSPLAGSRKNPFDYHTREKMIKSQFPEVVVLPLPDEPSDFTWSKSLDGLLESTFSGEKFSLYGSRDSFIQYYNGKFKTEELPAHGDYNATEIRARYASKVLDSPDFRAGILYAFNVQYKKVFPTVDVALFRNNGEEILLGKKDNSPLLRLPGGFVDPEDISYELAAERELFEEVGDLEVGSMQYEMSVKVDDWRYKNEDDKIITHLFSADFISGQVKASDDIVEVQWVMVSELGPMLDQGILNPEHRPLFNYLISRNKNSKRQSS